MKNQLKIIKICKISDSAINSEVCSEIFPQQIFKPSEMQEAFLRALIIFDDEVTKSDTIHLHFKKWSLLAFRDNKNKMEK